MARKPPAEERALIVAQDHRRKYGARLVFEVQRPEYIGDLENVTLLLDDGTYAVVQPDRVLSWESTKRYQLQLAGFATASEAESAGLHVAQALLLTAVSLNFGLRLNYNSYEPAAVFDRTASSGITAFGEGITYWPQKVFLDELTRNLAVPLRDRRLLLSMELFVASTLESNVRARFVMTVSALEPLAEQQDLGPEVGALVDALVSQLDEATTVMTDLRNSLRGRLLQLKRESIRQALRRLCAQWLSDDTSAWSQLDAAYALRSELLHEGKPNDPDLLLIHETETVSKLLRRIYQQAYAHQLQTAVAG